MAIFDNLFGAPPEYLTGLLGADETDKLRKQALTTGLVNSAIALIAQPRNQRYGSALPYLGKALMAGQQSGQGVYENALRGFETQQKLAELKRQQEQRKAQEELMGTITDPRERLFAQLAPTEFVKGQLATPKASGKLLTKEEQAQLGLPEVGRYQQKADGSYELVPGTAPKESAMPSAVQEYQFAVSQGYKGNFNQWKNEQKPAGVTVNYGAPVAGVDAQGNPVFFQPAKGGGAPSIVPGVAPPPREKNVTEGERKAATLLQRMEGSLSQLESATTASPEAQKPGVVQSALRGLPFGVGEAAANVVTPAARQQVEAAQLDILDAALTLGTGAAYTKEQLEGYRKSYFPQIGDSKKTIEDKADRLNNVLEAARIAAGGAGRQQIIPRNATMPNARNKQDILKQYGVQ